MLCIRATPGTALGRMQPKSSAIFRLSRLVSCGTPICIHPCKSIFRCSGHDSIPAPPAPSALCNAGEQTQLHPPAVSALSDRASCRKCFQSIGGQLTFSRQHALFCRVILVLLLMPLPRSADLGCFCRAGPGRSAATSRAGQLQPLRPPWLLPATAG
jgi:hypothetical protein